MCNNLWATLISHHLRFLSCNHITNDYSSNLHNVNDSDITQFLSLGYGYSALQFFSCGHKLILEIEIEIPHFLSKFQSCICYYFLQLQPHFLLLFKLSFHIPNLKIYFCEWFFVASYYYGFVVGFKTLLSFSVYQDPLSGQPLILLFVIIHSLMLL